MTGPSKKRTITLASVESNNISKPRAKRLAKPKATISQVQSSPVPSPLTISNVGSPPVASPLVVVPPLPPSSPAKPMAKPCGSSRIIAQELLNNANEQENIVQRRLANVSTETDECNEFEDEITKSPIMDIFTTEQILKLTNFNLNHIIDLYRISYPFFLSQRKRGPMPKISWMDSIFMLLCTFKSGNNMDHAAAMFKMKSNTFIDTIRRAANALLPPLKNKWFANRRRPAELDHLELKKVALLMDSTSIEVCRPIANFAEAKTFWDGKNCIYARKKECLVMASAPHYCLFVSENNIGSVHDYTIFKMNSSRYEEYLKRRIRSNRNTTTVPAQSQESNFMTETDNIETSSQSVESGETISENSYWEILADSGYIGSHPTPYLVRTIFRPTTASQRTPDEIRMNDDCKVLRVKVECFFGRLVKLWNVLAKPYKLDASNFDNDFDICVLLTNEHIEMMGSLDHNDGTFYAQTMNAKIEQYKANKEAKKKAREEYQKRKLDIINQTTVDRRDLNVTLNQEDYAEYENFDFDE